MSVSELQKRFDNKTLTGNTSFFVNILYFLWFFFNRVSSESYLHDGKCSL